MTLERLLAVYTDIVAIVFSRELTISWNSTTDLHVGAGLALYQWIVLSCTTIHSLSAPICRGAGSTTARLTSGRTS